MSTNIQDYVKRASAMEWQPLIEKGIHYSGVSVISLHFDEKKNRSTTIMLRFEPGASYPYHNHPGGEEIYVLTGEAELEDITLKEADYLFTPANFKHSVRSVKGCTLLLVIPEEVEIL